MIGLGVMGSFGLKIVESPYLQPEITWVDLPKLSRNRSKRLWKKLLKRMREGARPGWLSMFRINTPQTSEYYVCHPTVAAELRKQTTLIEDGVGK